MNGYAFFDEYRWVNNLDRVRKPAFQRTEVKHTEKCWKSAEIRLANSYQQMRKIQKANDAKGDGPCFMCPFNDKCDKASFSYYGGW